MDIAIAIILCLIWTYTPIKKASTALCDIARDLAALRAMAENARK